jgi:4-amino-4-deoxy-L-arabinose transferase-like glycosyltransferase
VGYHAFNEAHYFDLARRYLQMPVLSPWLEPAGLNPPLYPTLLRFVMLVFGPTVVVARALSTAAALGTAVVVFLLGKRFYGVSAGLGAALIMALAPGSVLVGRNIQIEPVLGLVLTSAALAWVIASDDESVPWAVAAGVMAGLALLLKMQGLVIIPAFVLAEVFRTRSLRRLANRVPLAALLSFCLVGLPWQLWNLLQPSQASTLTVRAAEMGVPNLRFFDMYFAREWYWMLSPGLAVVVVVGVLYLMWRHRPADVLVLLALGVNVVFYLFYHLHTYYLYPALPFAALCGAALMEPLEQRSARGAFATLCLVGLLVVPFALTTLAGKKLGYWSSDQVAAAAVANGVDPARTALAVSPLFRNSWEPALRLNGRGMRVVSRPLAPGDNLSPGERLISLEEELPPESADYRLLVRLTDTHVMPVFFGYGVDQSHQALFFFAVDQPSLVRVGPWWRFGMVSRTEPLDMWASLLSPEFTERIRSQASTQTPAPTSAP